MRIWILENVPDYEQATRIGVYISPVAAWDALYEQVNHHVLHQDKCTVRVAAEVRPDNQDLADVFVKISYSTGDTIELTGVFVEGSNAPVPPLSEWRDLTEVGQQLLEILVKEGDFTWINPGQEAISTHTWKFRKLEDAHSR